jgi:hypothetical protein
MAHGIEAIGSEIGDHAVNPLGNEIVHHDACSGCGEYPGDALTDALT